jgi:hypothetical protein
MLEKFTVRGKQKRLIQTEETVSDSEIEAEDQIVMTLIDGDRLNDSIHTELCADIKCDSCSMRTEGGGCRVEEWIDNAPVEEER